MNEAPVRTRVQEQVRRRQTVVPKANTVNLKEKQPPHEGKRHIEHSSNTAGRHPHEEGARPVFAKATVGKQRHEHEEEARRRLAAHADDERFQHGMREMRETHDLDEVDDDVEREATLLEWRAEEHTHRPKSPLWFAVLAAGTTVVIGLQLFFFANFIGAMTIALVGGLIYYIAQQKPATVRYRIMVDGVAFNNVLFHYQDLDSFNVIYEPGETKTVILRSNRRFAPLVHMEIGEVDPVEIRDILLEFLPEDLELEEPLVDILARRLGF